MRSRLAALARSDETARIQASRLLRFTHYDRLIEAALKIEFP
jgi:hypothetical protein